MTSRINAGIGAIASPIPSLSVAKIQGVIGCDRFSVSMYLELRVRWSAIAFQF
ncbi:hypothetical protein G7B40_036475 [Aetokthonos hydrillicola Thurmond2011]|uniref:Uncharacterized protein n=1 Tax=Aetokthonos hydrillicola Thurmond2011 TaxID=2712845 RepID=A0AAP5IE62_9CYAN|nr:hypothetical protein [Aetokthonos hydrillicola]MBO3457953.1 hypothetical protein [Aetokthonos hydrillicola CCALA 1050]MBW4587443.1 hypothetical protein [Aetokthonos hydrillicola CCALA 1050]MDR9900011.1 hypothetical protein [Aetokthonos hydrillicola Thurmond2011]